MLIHSRFTLSFLGHSLYYIGPLHGIKIYVPINSFQSTKLFQTHGAPLNNFVNILKYLSEVFQLSLNAIHVFFDDSSNTIAFNRDRALFFNLNYYLGLHDEECKFYFTRNTMTYWFMTICHELAHNIILVHDSRHEVSMMIFKRTFFFFF